MSKVSDEADKILAEQAEKDQRASDEHRVSRGLRAALDGALKREFELRHQVDLLSRIAGARATPPRWLAPKESRGGRHATAYLQITDTHFEEIIRPEEIDGLNAYNREIAALRLRKCFDHFIVLMRDYMKGVTYDGVVMPMTGDIFSGNIHEELKINNVSTLFDGLLHWVDPMVAGIRMLEKEFGKVHIPCVAGNHGRMTQKPIYKRYAQDNLDWLFYKLLAREFVGNENVTFQIADGISVQWKSYGTRFLAEHGNNGFNGGNGISGIFTALMLGQHRKTRKHIAMKKPYDMLVLGHFHQFVRTNSVIVGPALKGYDEYASGKNYEPDPAHPDSSAQAFWLVTPEHGVSLVDRIWCADRTTEGW